VQCRIYSKLILASLIVPFPFSSITHALIGSAQLDKDLGLLL
jgi:hypothetical protein